MILPAVNESACGSTPSPAFGVVSVLNFSHLNECVIVSHCLLCTSLMVYDVQHVFIYLFALCISFMEGCLLRDLA